MSFLLTAIGQDRADEFHETEISRLKNSHATFGGLTPARTDPFYPRKSDEKIMRTDAISATILVSNMLHDLAIDNDTSKDVSFFVCGGVFLEASNKYIAKVLHAFGKGTDIHNEQEQVAFMYRKTSPLLALETLTNSTTSFIAQYNGIKGHNQTYGNTCHSGYYAIQDAIQSQSHRALVVGANASGTYSYLTFKNFYPPTEAWRESACAAVLLFESEDCDILGTPLAKIKSMKVLAKAPSLTRKQRHPWKALLEDGQPEFVIYSGGYSTEEFEKNRAEVEAFCSTHFSWNHSLGGLGSATMMMNVQKAVEVLQNSEVEKVHVFNRDPYERISLIIVERPERS